MFVFTPSDIVGALFFALFVLIALLIAIYILLARLRSWLRRKWTSFTSRWSRAHA